MIGSGERDAPPPNAQPSHTEVGVATTNYPVNTARTQVGSQYQNPTCIAPVIQQWTPSGVGLEGVSWATHQGDVSY